MPLTPAARRTGLLALYLATSASVAAVYPPLKPVWQLDGAEGFYSPPTIVQGTVFASDVSGKVRAVNLADGAEQWTFTAPDKIYSGVAVNGPLGYVGGVDQTLYALDLASGQVKWSKQLDAVVYATPVVAGGLVLAGTGEAGTPGTVYAFDGGSGEQRWTFGMGDRLGSGLLVDGGTVYFGSYDQHLYALDVATGQPRWTFAAETPIDSMPLLADGVLFVKLTNDAVCALDPRSGAVFWRTTPQLAEVLNEPTTWSPLSKVGGLLYLALSDGRLEALDATTGKRRWVTRLGAVHAAPPTSLGELGLVGTKQGSLDALDLETGETLWHWSAPKPSTPQMLSGIMWPPVVAGNRVLASSLDGHLYAFDGQPTTGAREVVEQPAPFVDGPGRIAVGGLFPIGYVGVLARHGLPRDVLYDSQLTDVETLKRYDLVIVAGAPAKPDCVKAVQQYIREGGTAIIDYSATPINLPNLPERNALLGWTEDKSPTPGGFGTRGESVTPMTEVASSGPLQGIALAEGVIGEKSLGYVPDAGQLSDVQVFARYPSTVLPKNDKGQVVPAGGPAQPSILVGRLGQGKAVLCGFQVGLKSEYSGLDLEVLTIALVKLATAGRATPQIIPDTPHVGYNATLQSVAGENAPAADDEPVDSPIMPGAQGKLPKEFPLVEAEPAGEYNLQLKVPGKGGQILAHYWNRENYVRVDVSPSGLAIVRQSQGKAQTLDSAKVSLQPGQPVTVQDVCDRLTVRAGETYLKADLTGIQPGVIGQRGFGPDAVYQPTESVYFTDDFMRTDEVTGPWQTAGGTWSTTPDQNVDMGANPFSYKCDSPDGTATAFAGQDFWSEYQFTCAVHPTSGADGGSVGVGWYARDKDNLYLLRAAVRKDLKPREHGFQLLRVVDGQATVLAERPGGVNVGQWYGFHVRAEGPEIAVAVDGVRMLTATDTTFRSGKLALRVDHGAAKFDDVAAEAAVLPDPSGATIVGVTPDRAGLIDVDSWASPAMGWEPDPDTNGLFWRRETLYGDTDLTFDWPRVPDGSEIALVVDGDGANVESGYALRLKRSGDTGRLELSHDGRAIKAFDVPAGPRLKLAIHRRPSSGGQAANEMIEGVLNDRTVLTANVPSLGKGGRLGFRTVGFQPQMSAITLWSSNLSDFTFDTAPSDWWIASGTWDLTNRWSCVPEWSWFGGFSEQQAAVWGKPLLKGDLVLDYYVGSKMLDDKTEGYHGKSQERTGDFNLTICGDGRDVASGYSITLGPLGATGERGTKNRRISGATAQLRRDGKVVAKNDAFCFFSEAHNRWANIRAEKHGAEVALYVDGQLVLHYRDPEPLDEGYVALWTQGNGMLVPRVTLAYEAMGDERLSLR